MHIARAGNVAFGLCDFGSTCHADEAEVALLSTWMAWDEVQHKEYWKPCAQWSSLPRDAEDFVRQELPVRTFIPILPVMQYISATWVLSIHNAMNLLTNSQATRQTRAFNTKQVHKALEALLFLDVEVLETLAGSNSTHSL